MGKRRFSRVAAPLVAAAQQAEKVWRIGLLKVINLTTAKALGLTLPEPLLLSAHDVTQ